MTNLNNFIASVGNRKPFRFESVERMEARTKSVVDARQQKEGQIKAMLSQADAKVKQAETETVQALEQAEAAEDVKDYHAAQAAHRKAQEDLRNAREEKDFYQKQLDALRAQKHLVPVEEYQAAANEVMADLDSFEQETRGELARLSDDMAAVGDAFNAVLTRVNAALKAWQHEAYREGVTREGPNAILTFPEEITVCKADTIQWARSGVKTDAYWKTTGRAPEEDPENRADTRQALARARLMI